MRGSKDRGHSQIGWLDSHHTFSFSDYYDPKHMGFRALRVINEDRVAAGQGFGRHPHRDMEIVSYVLGGALEHKDSLGTGSVIRPGDVQLMSAGTGVTHSEFNHSKTDPVHFLQIWIVPEQQGLAPRYEQKSFTDADLRDRLRVVVSRDGRDGSLLVRQDASILVARLSPGARVTHELAAGRHAWAQVARGRVTALETTLGAGDGAAITSEPRVVFTAAEESELLLFDLA